MKKHWKALGYGLGILGMVGAICSVAIGLIVLGIHVASQSIMAGIGIGILVFLVIAYFLGRSFLMETGKRIVGK